MAAAGGAAADAGDAVVAVPTTPPESRAEGETVVGAADDTALAAEGDPVAGAAVVASISPPDGKGDVGSAAVGGGDGVGVGPSVG